MNKAQENEVRQAPVSCQGVLTKAYGGNSRSAAIKAMCLRCVGYVRQDVADCTAFACPLHPYRPYQAGEDTEEGPENEGFEGKASFKSFPDAPLA